MKAYIIRRILLIIPSLFFVTLIVFLSVRFVPGDVVDLMITEMRGQTTREDIELTKQGLKVRIRKRDFWPLEDDK